MILLHEEHLREFVSIWREAKAAEVSLPESTDSDYQSMEALLFHLLGCARGYMVWMCKVLELPDPGIDPAPTLETVEAEADAYLEHVLERWRTPLKEVEEARFHRPEHPSGWKVLYCVDAMMEHAVMHPIRHTYQLRRLMG
jgi:uncharacterized damage-inducible protein DinB